MKSPEEIHKYFEHLAQSLATDPGAAREIRLLMWIFEIPPRPDLQLELSAVEAAVNPLYPQQWGLVLRFMNLVLESLYEGDPRTDAGMIELHEDIEEELKHF